jgi:hypothetical protein
LDARKDLRELVAFGGEVAVKTVGQPVSGPIKIDVDRGEDGALGHLIGVTLHRFVGGLDAGLGAAVEVDRVERKFLRLHGKKGR